MELTKSEQSRAGLQKSFQSGTSAKASTVCYGYKVSRAGELMIDPIEANTVLFIFHRFMNGDSLGKISDALARKGIVSPTGRVTWSRETISKLLANEKYVGDVVLGKTNVIDGVHVKSHDASTQVLMRAHHPAIISHELFNAVQREKNNRSRSRLAAR
ncbi:recombinase family protein [uncultured Oscillibacter sp.]|uniref:recombinase family protein n=1 Tax=uncultured Oscillibacter sp. TaxID=876091 RepID=UPI002615C8E5|nr:recombinase family protein [uncultured Oscillibacter sp.]